jgi:para-nitrobenzyl esterase
MADREFAPQVPFARPPVGELRWQPAARVQQWDGMKEATAYSASCVQSKNAFTAFSKMSEDCLYLNVYLPGAPTGAPKPAMVFFYGGSDAQGSAMFPCVHNRQLFLCLCGSPWKIPTAVHAT